MAKTLGYVDNPGYIDLILDSGHVAKTIFSPRLYPNYSYPGDFFRQVRHNFDFNLKDITIIVHIAVLFVLARSLYNSLLYTNGIIDRLNFDLPTDAKRFVHSSWKFLLHTLMWIYSYCLLIASRKYNYFDEPYNLWNGWRFRMHIPDEIKWLYLIVSGFYVHLIYTSLVIDQRGKEFCLMLFHDVLALGLIIFSYAFRFHRQGLLVLFLHDMNDVLLEYTKCNIYLRKRNCKFYHINDSIAKFGFFSFIITWFISRLYWFPLKVIYTTSVTCINSYYSGGAFYLPFNIMLILLLCLNIYWFFLASFIFLKKLLKRRPSKFTDYESTINLL